MKGTTSREKPEVSVIWHLLKPVWILLTRVISSSNKTGGDEEKQTARKHYMGKGFLSNAMS